MRAFRRFTAAAESLAGVIKGVAPTRFQEEAQDMSEVVYVSHVRIERERGPLRLAYLPAEPKPVTFGVHGAIAEHYGVSPEIAEPHATTIDYVVAAAAG